MKRIRSLISASAIAAVTALPVFAQETPTGNERAVQIAQDAGACSSAGGIVRATFDSPTLVRVGCAGSGAGALEGGLGTTAALGGTIAAVVLIGLASDGSDTTTTTTTTTGSTN